MSNTSLYAIYSPSRRVIWGQPFASKEGAQRELMAQLEKLPASHHKQVDWIVQEHACYVSGDGPSARKVQEEFEKF